MTQPSLRQRLQGLGAALLILLLVVGTPAALTAIGAAPWRADLDSLESLLLGPDDGTLALVVITFVAWIAWLVLTSLMLVEAVARVRGLTAPTLPGLGLPQRAVGQLVAVAALLFIAAPTVVAAFPAAPALASGPAPVPETPQPAPTAKSPVPPASSPVLAGDETPAQEPATIDYTVKRGDSLWKIADRLFGDGARYGEIVDLNREVLNGRPDFILPSTVLKVPNETAEPAGKSSAEVHVVEPGDTLSAIAEAELGDANRYPELFDASRETVQPDGRTLTDPDIIVPGWEIRIPDDERHRAEAAEPPVEVTPPPPPQSPAAQPPDHAEPEPERVADAPDPADAESAAGAPGWLLPGLTGGGAVLAALVLLAVRAHRNTQLRYRRPGQTVKPPPENVQAAEKTAFVTGAQLVAPIGQLDRALRHLASTLHDDGRATPPLATATLAGSAITLHLAEDAELPEPWTGEGKEWSTQLDDSIPDCDVIPPYPLLVTVGQDEAGALHLLNLEHLRVLSLTGDPAAAAALARHLGAELALNPWSVLVDVDMAGVGEELAPLDSMRLRHHADGKQVISSVTKALTAARDAGFDDPDPYRVVITTSDGTGELIELLASPVPRLGAALVSLAAPVSEATVIAVDEDERLCAPLLGLDLQAAGLTSEEAAACAAIVDLSRESEAVRVAPFEQAADGWRALADQAGALLDEFTESRTEGPVDGSLLPQPAEEYADVAATTAQDVEALAPVVSEEVRRAVEDADPTLDEDVAAWFDTDTTRPKLTLLGPVNVYAHGEAAAAIHKRRPYFVELLAYLALHPQGVTGSAVADAFAVAPSRSRTDLGYLREWLGENPRTGEPHLPRANHSPVFRETGVKTYQAVDVLVDLDMFRRLRARGEARGAEGIEDLKTAMSLVQGQPFSLLRERGWSWLLDDERLHETTGCSIVDTAHIIVVDALAKGDLTTAHETAETACKAAPYDDICRLDLVKVAAAEGHPEAADQMLTDNIFNRTDDHLPPIDLSERTGEVVGKQGWGTSGRPKDA